MLPITSNALIKKQQVLIVLLLWFLCMTSCYSVRVVSKHGIPEPDPTNDTFGFFNGKQVHHLDTTVRKSVFEGDLMALEQCGNSGFFAIEYRTTLGDIILSGITFGSKNRIRVKYVCLKEE